MLLAPAAYRRQRFAASKMAEFSVSSSTRVDQAKVNPGDKFCFKSGAEISHSIVRISILEDERASSSSSTKSFNIAILGLQSGSTERKEAQAKQLSRFEKGRQRSRTQYPVQYVL